MPLCPTHSDIMSYLEMRVIFKNDRFCTDTISNSSDNTEILLVRTIMIEKRYHRTRKSKERVKK